MMTVKCEQVRDELVAYVRDELEPDRRTEIEEHLVRCGDCTREWEGAREVMGVMKIADAASTKELVQGLVGTALQRRASDIHVEKNRGLPRVRLRIDGVLHEQPDMAPPLEQYEPVIARIKSMADMNLSEKRVPQDGRIRFDHDGNEYELRVSIFPYFDGESAVARILDRSNVLIGLDRLGLDPQTLARIVAMVEQPGGLILTAGPTGAGKTTLLYSLLDRLNRPEVKVMTIEDPVEYLLPGVNQANLNRKAGLQFANALRAFLRQDPDVIMVSEIRDLETLEMMMAAAATGHLVLSTVHTPDSTSAITRLLDVGIAPFLLSATLIGVVGQRLVRRVCPACRRSYMPPEALLEALGFTAANRPETFFQGAGCPSCGNTGYQGRVGLFELLSMDKELAQMLIDRAPEAEIRSRALELDRLWSFAADARAKVAAGTTTVEEIDRVVRGLTTPAPR
jgi:type II secretory ATPase GspE/PulE/Tfp pilus assembly ATPase PilB-like protein